MQAFNLPAILIRHPRLTSVLVGLLTLLMMESFVQVDRARRLQIERNSIQTQASTARARLESELNASLSLSLGLSTFVLSNPRYTPEEFARVAAALVRIQPAIRSVAMAPDNVIRQIYPLQGNEKALGLRYLDTPAQRDAVLRLMRDQQPVVAGPVNLVQGGTGLINRIPILLPDKGGQTRYWGLASIAVDPYPIFWKTGILATTGNTLEYALRGRDGLGSQGEVFLGKASLFQDPKAILMEVLIPGGSWQLAARGNHPDDAQTVSPNGLLLQLVALTLAILAGGLAFATLSAHRRMQTMALQDSLTGLANRHQFNLRGENLFSLAKRSGRHLTLLNMDLNDFKLVNDTLGHSTGDRLLVHVASQLRQCFRGSDLVARVGGDEFLALLPDTQMGPTLETLLRRIREAVAEPLDQTDPPLRAEICIGAATCNANTATLDELMRQADEAMYRAKVQEKYHLHTE